MTTGIFYPDAYEVPKAEAASSQVHWGSARLLGAESSGVALSPPVNSQGLAGPSPGSGTVTQRQWTCSLWERGPGRVWEEGCRSSFSPGAVSAGQGREPQ